MNSSETIAQCVAVGIFLLSLCLGYDVYSKMGPGHYLSVGLTVMGLFIVSLISYEKADPSLKLPVYGLALSFGCLAAALGTIFTTA